MAADRTVRVRLEAVTAAYEAKMAKAGATTKGVAGAIDDLGTRGSSSLKTLSGGLLDVTGKTAALAGGVAIAGAALFKFINYGIDGFTRLADQVDTYQDITGSSAEESSRMVAVANTLGVSTDALAGGMARLSRNVTSNADALRDQGVAIARNANGSINLSETLLNVADAYQRAGSGAAGNAVAQAAFGRGYQNLIDILERSRVELEGFWAEAERNQQILSEDDLRTAREYEIATRELEMAWQGLAIAGAEALLPTLIDVADALTTVIQKVNELKDGPLGDVMGVIAKGLPVGQALDVLNALTGDSDDAAASTENLGTAVDQLGRTASTAAADGLAIWGDQLERLRALTLELHDAQDGIVSTVGDLAASVSDAREAGDRFATSLDAGSRTGIENRRALSDLADQVLSVAEALREQGASESDVANVTAAYRTQLVATLTQLGFNRAEVENYLGVLGMIPGGINTSITLDDSQALAAIARVQAAAWDLMASVGGLFGMGDAAARNADAARAVAGTLGGPASVPGAGLPGFQPPETSRRSGVDEALQRRLAEDARQGRMAEFGGITVEEYQAYLRRRIAATAAYTEEWGGLMSELARVNEDVGQGWRDAADQMKAMEDAWWEILRRQHEVGDISTTEYLEQLQKRLAGLQKFSDEWMETWREIQSVRDDGAIAIIQAVEEQRLRDMAFYGLADQRALSDLRLSPVSPAPVVVRAGSTKSWSPNITMVTPDPARSGDSVLQRSRDDAYLRDL